MILIASKKKQSAHEIEEHTYTCACSKETPDTKNESVVDINDLIVE